MSAPLDRPDLWQAAEIVAARTDLHAFMGIATPDYVDGWCVRDVCANLHHFSAQVAARKSPRVLISLPPRTGKTLHCCERFPAWHLGQHPTHRAIVASYSLSLARDATRAAREVAQSLAYRAIFPKVQLAADTRAKADWRTRDNGGMKAVGVGGALTGFGADCFPAGTMVATPDGPVDIAILALSPYRVVWSYDHDTNTVVARPILAGREIVRNDLIEVEFASGSRSRSTPEHRYFVRGRGYVAAQDLQPGDQAIALKQDVRGLRGAEGGTGPLLHPVLQQAPQFGCGSDLLDVRGPIQGKSIQGSEVSPEGVHRELLQQDVRMSQREREEAPQMPDVLRADHGGDAQVLLRGLQRGRGSSATNGPAPVSAMRQSISTQVEPDSVLQQGVCGSGAFAENDWRGQLSLQGRPELRQALRRDAKSCDREGWESVPCVSASAGTLLHPPYRRGGDEQRPGESDRVVSDVSCGAPQITSDTVALVRRVRSEGERVYDIQVEGTSCFFAENVLVHNCLIIDDPHKNAREALSQQRRDDVWAWYQAVARTRVQPGGGILGIMTRWHEDDLVGRLLTHAKHEGWVVINYAAIAGEDEYFPDGRLRRRKGASLQPRRYDRRALEDIRKTIGEFWWAALYTGRPTAPSSHTWPRHTFRFWTQGPPTPEQESLGWLQKPERFERFIISADLTFGSQSDDASWVDLLVHGLHKGRLYLLEEDRFRAPYPVQRARLEALARKYPGARILVEKAAHGAAILQELASLPGIEAVSPQGDKVARAEAAAPKIAEGCYLLPHDAPWALEFLAEVSNFPNCKDKDRVDTAGQAIRACLQTPRGTGFGRVA